MNSNLNKYFTIIILYLTLTIPSKAVYTQPSHAKVDVLSVKQGINGLEVNNFFMDSDHKLWVSTSNCLNICSPGLVENVYYGNGNKDIHSNNTISQIRDTGTEIEIYFEGVLTYYDIYNKTTKEFHKQSTGLNNPTNSIRYINTIKLKEDIYLVGQKEQELLLFSMDSKLTHNIQLPIGLKANQVELNTGYNGYLLTSQEQIFRFDKDKNLERCTILKPLNYDIIKNNLGKDINQKRQIFHIDKKGRLWFSLLQYPGVYMLDTNTRKLVLNRKLPTNKLFPWVSEDNSGKLIFSSTDRYRFTKENYLMDSNGNVTHWTYLQTQFTLPRKIIADDFYDKMFVSTYRNILILNFKSHDFITSHFVNEAVKNERGAYGNLIWDFTQIDNDSIFVSSEKPAWAIHHMHSDTVDVHTPDRTMNIFHCKYSRTSQSVWAVAFFRTERKMFQLLEIDPRTNEFTKFKDPTVISAMTMDRNDDIYCGTKNKGGIVNFVTVNQNSQSYTIVRPLPMEIYSMEYDEKTHTIWCINFLKGVFKIDLNNPKEDISLLDIGNPTGINYYSVNMGSDNKLFISTSQGLYIWDRNTNQLLEHITIAEGLSANSVCATVEDKHGNLWISTFYGLNYYNIDLGYTHNYFSNSGLPDEEFNRAAYFKDTNGDIYFGGANGYIKIDIKRFYSRNFEISTNQLLLEDQNRKEKKYRLPTKKVFIHRDHQSKVELSLFNKEWELNEGVRYLKNMSPFDDKWIVQDDNTYSFTHLPIGEYNLKVRAVSAEGIMSNELILAINVYKYWYEKTWFLSILAMLALGGIVFVVLHKMYNSKRDKERDEMKFEKRISELELGILQAQMNPHFIFNSISAIQAKVDEGEKYIVSQYLSDFAGLMRLLLESSRRKSMILKDEIRLLKLYVNLEKLRFGDKMEFEFIIDPNIDVNYTKIPTMILQPFVENAINHGLFHKIGKGKLTIEMNNEPKFIYIKIEDNGIGRTKAREIRKRSLKNYQSRAMSIIEERLDILKKTKQFSIDISIVDLYNNLNEPSGTSIGIRIAKEDTY